MSNKTNPKNNSGANDLIKCEFYVEGMHCAACELLIEKKLAKYQGIKNVDAKLTEGKVHLQLTTDVNQDELRADLNKLIEPDGYQLLAEKSDLQKNIVQEFSVGFIIAGTIMGLFLLVQKLGIVSVPTTGEITLPFVFIIGIVASLSSCMAVVGGLVLSLSSNIAKDNHGNRALPMVLFHVSRIVGFFILGGILGVLGSLIKLSSVINFFLDKLLHTGITVNEIQTQFLFSLVVFVVMIILAINLLDIFHGSKKLQLKMPKAVGKNILHLQETPQLISAVLLGVLTFFLPCGFTQSMQLYALSSGTFLNAASIMLVFSLGTLPVLALISFAAIRLSKNFQSGTFYKTSGFLVLFFAIFNFLGALAAVGLIKPLGI
jgi:uncharacterized protein